MQSYMKDDSSAVCCSSVIDEMNISTAKRYDIIALSLCLTSPSLSPDIAEQNNY